MFCTVWESNGQHLDERVCGCSMGKTAVESGVGNIPGGRPRSTLAGRASALSALIRRDKMLLLMFLPGICFYILFAYVPMYGIMIAFQKFSFSRGIWGSTWVGLDNFINFYHNPYFWKLIRNTFMLNVYSLIFAFPAPIILALLLNEMRNAFFKKSVQMITYIPHFISTVVIIAIVSNLLSPTSGIVNHALHSVFGLEPIYFMNEAGWFRTLYISTDIWVGIGWGSIIYMAALSGIDPHLYEAAHMDGCSRWRAIFHITVPGIMSTIIILLLFRIGSMMSVGFDKVFLMYTPATYETADVLSTYVYRRGLVNAEFSFATAVGVLNNLINICFLITANKLARRYTETSLW